LLLICTAFGCATSTLPPTEPTDRLAELLGHGYKCLLTPTSFDPPGIIFKVDERGVKDYVTNRASDLPVQTSTIAVGTYHGNRDLKASFVATMLRQFGALSKLDVNTDLDRAQNVTVGLVAPVQREITEDTDMPKVNSWFASFVQSTAYAPDAKYYVVR